MRPRLNRPSGSKAALTRRVSATSAAAAVGRRRPRRAKRPARARASRGRRAETARRVGRRRRPASVRSPARRGRRRSRRDAPARGAQAGEELDRARRLDADAPDRAHRAARRGIRRRATRAIAGAESSPFSTRSAPNSVSSASSLSARWSTEAATPSTRRKVRENSRPMPGDSIAAPLTPKGEPSAAVIAAIARASSRRRMTMVASL